MTGKYMNTAMLFDPGQLLIMHEHAIDAVTLPSATKVSVTEGFASIYHEMSTHFQITPESLCAIVGEEDQSIFAAFTATHKDG